MTIGVEIILLVAFALIGVTVGLLGSGVPFGFMALLGMLSLTGMLPLVIDPFFQGLAVTVMDGLSFATVLSDPGTSILCYLLPGKMAEDIASKFFQTGG